MMDSTREEQRNLLWERWEKLEYLLKLSENKLLQAKTMVQNDIKIPKKQISEFVKTFTEANKDHKKILNKISELTIETSRFAATYKKSEDY